MPRFTSRFQIFDVTVTLHVAVMNSAKRQLFARFRSQRNKYHSIANRKRDDILHQKLFISYRDEFEVPVKLL